MHVNIRLFSILREHAGTGEVRLEVKEGSRAADVRDTLLLRYPSLATCLQGSALAVNREYVGESAIVNDGDEIALIPPVSGG